MAKVYRHGEGEVELSPAEVAADAAYRARKKLSDEARENARQAVIDARAVLVELSPRANPAAVIEKVNAIIRYLALEPSGNAVRRGLRK